MKRTRLLGFVPVLVALLLVLAGCGGETVATVEDFCGVWEYDDYDIWVSFNDDETYDWYTSYGLDSSGDFTVEDGTLSLDYGMTYVFDEDGALVDGDGDTLFASELPEVFAEDFLGTWEYEDMDNWLIIYSDYTFDWYYDDGTYIEGDYYMEDEQLVISYDDETLSFSIDGAGGLIDSDGDALFASELPEFPDPYFEENGIAIDYVLTDGDVDTDVANGMCVYTTGTEGSGYTVGTAGLEITLDSVSYLDGGRAVYTLTTVTGYPNSYTSSFSAFSLSSWLLLYDYYSGVLLPDNDAFSSGNDSFYYSFESDGEEVDIYFSREDSVSEWVGDYRMTVTTTYTINMPDDYDGLVLSMVPEGSTYSEHTNASYAFDDLTTYVEALELPLDIQNAMNCRICQYD